MIGLKFNIHFI